ncbi:MAG: ribulose-phosphate 3-epimerase [Pseudolysinimonas sp.]
MIEIAASILSADFTQLGAQLREAFTAGVARVHVDVMDGQFVPNLSMGPEVLAAVRSTADAFGATVTAHLMIVQPERFVSTFVEAGAHRIIVHVESALHLLSTLQRIRQLGAAPAVAIDPSTSLVMLDEILAEVDLVLVMGVEPGFGGQRLHPASLEKIGRLKQMLAERRLERVEIAVDGGVHVETIGAVAKAGVNYAVVGSALFNSHSSVTENLRALREAASRSVPVHEPTETERMPS